MGIAYKIWRIVFLYVYFIVASITEDLYKEEVFNITDGSQIVIKCTHSSIRIISTALGGATSTCRRETCNLHPEDDNSIKKQCEGLDACTLESNWTTACLKEKEHPYINLTYYCKGPSSADLNCNFETSICNWNHSSKGNTRWIISKDIPIQQSNTIITGMHTAGQVHGSFAYIIGENMTEHKMAVMESRRIDTQDDKCMTFRYCMDAEELKIYQTKGGGEFKMKKRKTNEWEKGQLLLKGDGSNHLFIEGKLHNNNEFIALDDVNIFDGPCGNVSSIYCNFENTTNGCTYEITPRYDLKLEKKTGGNINDSRPRNDHTTDSENGSYLLFLWNNIMHNHNKTSVKIKVMTSTRKCFSMWYYMIGRRVGTLNIYGLNVQNDTDLYMSIPNDDQRKWRPVYMSVVGVKEMIMEYEFKSKRTGGIALDDIYISDGACTVKSLNSTCVGLHDEVEINCTLQDVIDPKLTFDPPLQAAENCQTEDDIRKSIEDHCQNLTDNIPCTFNLSHFIRDIDVCFALKKQLLIEYSCTDSAVSHTESSTTSYSAGSAVGRTETSKSFSAVVTDSLPENQNQGSSNSTGLTAGVVIAVCIIVVIGVVIVIFIRRRSLSANEKTNHNIDGRNTDDYIGNQSNALPPTNGHVKTVSTKNNYNDLETRYDKQNYTEIKEDGFPQEVTGKTQHDYIDICPENKVAEQKTTAVQPQQNEIGYTCLDPAETGFNRMKATKQELEKANSSAKNTGLFTNSDNLDESKIDTKTLHPVTPENYTILDPNETGFDRSKSPEHRASPYELAKPIQNHENDPYCLSKEGEYDSTSNIHHKETDENVYSHSVENVYDSARFTRDKDGKDDTYDHFFGQKTEDDYDISKST